MRGGHAIGVDARGVLTQVDGAGVVDVGRLAHQGLDVVELAHVLLGHKGERPAFLAGAARAADTVDVVGRLLGHVEVHHVAHVGDVDAAREHVGCHQDLHAAVTERLQGALALRLAAVAVDGLALKAKTGQSAHAGVGTALGAHEHDDTLRALLLQDLGQHGVLLVGRDGHHELVDGLGRRGDGRDLHAGRVTHQVGDGAHALVVERGREQQGLTVLAAAVHDGAHLRQKAHVEHTVGLVEHQGAHFVKVRRALLDQVDQTARRGHQNIAAARKRLLLRSVGKAAHHRDRGVAGAFGDGRAHLVDLLGKLTRGCDHEHEGAAAARLVAAAASAFALLGRRDHVAQLVHGGQQEGSRLAGAGLRGGKQVTARKHLGDGGRLHRGGQLVAHIGHGVEHSLRKAQVAKARGLDCGLLRRGLLGRELKGLVDHLGRIHMQIHFCTHGVRYTGLLPRRRRGRRQGRQSARL